MCGLVVGLCDLCVLGVGGWLFSVCWLLWVRCYLFVGCWVVGVTCVLIVVL